MEPEGAGRRLAAIMFTDIVGYTALMAESEEKGLRVRERNRSVVRPLLEQYNGERIEETGDEFFAVFASAVDAVNCALAVQEAVGDDPELKLRIGVHLGETLLEGGKLYGDGVNVASRIRPLAEPGSVYASGEVYRAIRNQPGIEAQSLGEKQLKNVPEPVAVYAISGTAAAPRPRSEVATEPVRGVLPWMPWAAAALVVLAMGVAWWLYRPAPALAPIRSIAVLPLENLSGDAEQEYFADGMTEALIGDLARIGALTVISRTSVMQYKGARKPLPEIAQELGADGIVEGTVMRAGDRVRITAQLIDARNDRHLWSDRYDRELADVLGLQSEVARAIAQQVRVTLTPKEETRLSSARAVNPDAHEAYLKGRAQWARGTPERRKLALGYFEEAIQTDPGYALGYAGLADAYSSMALFGHAPPSELMPKAQAAARKALGLDDTLPEAHFSAGIVLLYYDWDFAAAEQEFRRALELNPSYARGHLGLGFHFSLTGRNDQALDRAQLALKYDPLSPGTRAAAAYVHYLVRDYDEAERLFREVIALDAHHVLAYETIGHIYSLTSRHDEAIAQYEKLDSLVPGAGPLGGLGYAYAMAGRRGDALRVLDELERQSPETYASAMERADIYVGLGDHDQAFEWLERAYAERTVGLIFLRGVPTLDPLNSDPRFQDLLRRIGFPES